MNYGVKTIIYPVRDLDQAKKIFTTLLGAAPLYDESFYVGYRVADQDIGLDPNGHAQGMTGPVGYYTVDDIHGCIKVLQDSGAEIVSAVRDVGGGRLIAILKDADGNPFGLIEDTQKKV